MFAAALDGRVRSVVAEAATLSSYRTLTKTDRRLAAPAFSSPTSS
jgi:hypothetical protein